jgi:hypothetical protein
MVKSSGKIMRHAFTFLLTLAAIGVYMVAGGDTMNQQEAAAKGYTHYPRRVVYRKGQMPRPPCDSCGPFASEFVRVAGRDEFGPIYQCSACDRENEVSR